MSDFPPPLTPPGCDLAGNDWYPLYFDRLRKSKWWRKASDLARARNVMLWGEAYRAVPAGSLPDDDDELAEAAGFGMDADAFAAVKEEIMAPWVLCSDGRWYHPMVCEQVLEAWERLSEKRRLGRERQARARSRTKAPAPAVTRDNPTCHASPPPMSRVTDPPVTRDMSDVTRDTATTEQDRTVEVGANAPVASTSPKRPKPNDEPWKVDPDFQAFWNAATEPMRRRAKAQKNVWPSWRKLVPNQGAERLIAALRAYVERDEDVRRGMGQPALYRWLNDGGYEQWLDQKPDAAGWSDDKWRRILELVQQGTPWPNAAGPRPGNPGCLVPRHLLVTPIQSGAA